MKIAYGSDLHLEFEGLVPESTGADVLILAGDILLGVLFSRNDAFARKKKKDYYKFLDTISSQGYSKIYYVFGNHEYYRGSIESVPDQIREGLKNYPVTILQDDSEIFEGIHFIGSTLWTDLLNFNPIITRIVEGAMCDYYDAISYQGRLLRGEDTYNFNKKHVDFISGCLGNCSLPTVVLTHHTPSHKSIVPKYMTTNHQYVNYGYHNSLDGLFHAYPHLRYWIHGHTHERIEYGINEGTVLCNPRGYCGEYTFPEYKFGVFDFDYN